MNKNRVFLCLNTGILMLLFLLPLQANASIIQQITVSYDGDPSVMFDPSEHQAGDRIEGATEADIDRALIAEITSPVGAYYAKGSVGEFGNYGVEGENFQSGEMHVQVYIENNDIVNVTGTSQNVSANFIIDGGEFNLWFAPLATLEYTLSIVRDFTGVRFQSHGVMENLSNLLTTTFVSSGDDIGAVFDGIRTVDIPISFQSVDLGVLLSGDSMALSYQLDIVATVPQYAEFLDFKFQDPLSVGGFVRPTVHFSPVNTVSQPATLMILLLGLLLGAIVGKRRRLHV